jgi:hypothetical protein
MEGYYSVEESCLSRYFVFGRWSITGDKHVSGSMKEEKEMRGIIYNTLNKVTCKDKKDERDWRKI